MEHPLDPPMGVVHAVNLLFFIVEYVHMQLVSVNLLFFIVVYVHMQLVRVCVC